MKPENIDAVSQNGYQVNEEAQRKRKKEAIQSAISSTMALLLTSCVKLLLRWHYQMENTFWGTVILLLSLIELGMIIPVWILLRKRLEEIKGGEEDVAAQY